MRYYIIDDDLASRKILNRIISDNLLGEIVGEAGDAFNRELEIISCNPDIVLIDLLMPNQDGIETTTNLRARNFKGKIIMISQVENKDMVAKAYNEGIEYFIHKPINLVEVSSVINKVIEQINMERSLNKIKESLFNYNNLPQQVRQENSNDIYKILNSILGDLGILGESGSNDLIEIMYHFHKSSKKDLIYDNLALKDIYVTILSKDKEKIEGKDLKALEQRIRRTVNQAMINLASIGLIDYANPKFEHYATKFFDFNEIRLKMRELDKEMSQQKAKINLKKFVYALYNEILSKLE